MIVLSFLLLLLVLAMVRETKTISSECCCVAMSVFCFYETRDIALLLLWLLHLVPLVLMGLHVVLMGLHVVFERRKMEE